MPSPVVTKRETRPSSFVTPLITPSSTSAPYETWSNSNQVKITTQECSRYATSARRQTQPHDKGITVSHGRSSGQIKLVVDHCSGVKTPSYIVQERLDALQSIVSASLVEGSSAAESVAVRGAGP